MKKATVNTNGNRNSVDKNSQEETKMNEKQNENPNNTLNNDAISANSNNTVNSGASTMVEENNEQEEKTMTRITENPKTLEELKAQIGDAGNHFIEKMSQKSYGDKWFDYETLLNDPRVAKVVGEIETRGYVLDRIIAEGGDLNTSTSLGYYMDIISLALNIINDTGYYDPEIYGDFRPFMDYCEACFTLHDTINFLEYGRIRAFFENNNNNDNGGADKGVLEDRREEPTMIDINNINNPNPVSYA